MRKLLFVLFVVSFCTVAIPELAKADRVPELTRFVSGEITSISNAVDRDSISRSGSRSVLFKQFLIRIQAMIGIEVPWTAKVQIVPEVEMLWQQ